MLMRCKCSFRVFKSPCMEGGEMDGWGERKGGEGGRGAGERERGSVCVTGPAPFRRQPLFTKHWNSLIVPASFAEVSWLMTSNYTYGW